MSAWSAPELAPLLARLAPYARASFERAAALAARLHAEEISAEHWLAALLEDEECAATRLVLHAFADPETIGVEVLALCAGIMLVGSDRTLPFSVLGVEALRAARTRARARADGRVEPADLFSAAHALLPAELRARLALLPGAVLAPGTPLAPDPNPGSAAQDPLFRHFSERALRALGASGRAAAALARSAIGPAHLLLGALEVDAELREETALTPGRARMACSGLDEDPTPRSERRLGADQRLHALLQELPPGAETLDVMGWLLGHGSEELVALLRRQKVTSALLERCRGAYRDPLPPGMAPPAGSAPGDSSPGVARADSHGGTGFSTTGTGWAIPSGSSNET
jgi:hypothetical protein